MSAMADETADRCSHCKRRTPDVAGLTVEGEEFGFCSIGCLAVFVRTRWIETAA